MSLLTRLLCTCFCLAGLWSPAQVVVNEVFYNAPEDLDDLEYIELYNSGSEAVDLSGWSFTKGIKFKFPEGTRIEANGFVVLCRNRERFQEFYDVPIAGTFDQKLSNDGERLELANGSGKVVDGLSYSDTAPWPLGADGLSGSLERITPEASGADPSNWTSSSLSADRIRPAGTPGKPNGSFSAHFPPVIAKVKFAPENPRPNQAITVEAEMRDSDAVREIELLYRVASRGKEGAESAVPMTKAATGGKWSATIPGQSDGELIRFRVRAMNEKGAQRFFPAETEPRPALSAYAHAPVESGKIPFAWIITTTERASQQTTSRSRGGGVDRDEMMRMQAAAILEQATDLAGAWFELTANQPLTAAEIRTLRPLFAARLSERNNIIDEVLEGPNIEQKFGRFPEIVRAFQTNLAATLKPHLTAEQSKNLGAWLAKQAVGASMFGNDPRMMVRIVVSVEAAWYAVTAKADIDEARLATLRPKFVNLYQQRNELLDQAVTVFQQRREQREQFDNFRQSVEGLDEKFVADIKPALSPAQDKQFQEWRGERNMFMTGRRPPTARTAFSAAANTHRSAFVYFDPPTKKLQLFDFVEIDRRSSGHKVRFNKDQPLNQMTTVNLIFDNDRAALCEPLAYEVFRRAGLAAEQSYHVRLWFDGRPSGYIALVEQPNRAFFRRNKINDNGNMYKLLWYERGVVGQHEKKTNTREGHDDIVAVVAALEKAQGDEQWAVIKKHFDVEQVAGYFAVTMILSHWDGFFNNYFTYHDVEGTGKWTMYPWDQDKTWGIHDGIHPPEIFYDMPLTFGMADNASGSRGSSRRGFSMSGNNAWWRPPGYFSGPLLANPEFRKIFLARVKDVLEKVYTPAAFGPVIDNMVSRLRVEIKIRAELQNENPQRALQKFDMHIQNFRDHLEKRREFLLSDPELKTLATSSR